ncbi:hypothetical protein ACFPRL_21600 [Pseudoclavibacter helvolus]
MTHPVSSTAPEPAASRPARHFFLTSRNTESSAHATVESGRAGVAARLLPPAEQTQPRTGGGRFDAAHPVCAGRQAQTGTAGREHRRGARLRAQCRRPPRALRVRDSDPW